ncbi:MAG: cellulose synthase complex periplasmic endoglucanase BcsZ [Bryobacterales bacterium]
MTRRQAVAGGALAGLHSLAGFAPARADSESRWLLWESYAQRFLSREGRVIDFHANDVTTSEGQSYAAFFSLVAGDRARFDLILDWTNQNLAGGRLGDRLPAWLWGRREDGTWSVLDENSAADSDLWLAYVLLEAGRIWNDDSLTDRGRALAVTIARREVRRLRGLGAMLLPGPEGFNPEPGVYQLNPSYVPLQLALRLSDLAPDSPWGRVARQTPALIAGSARHGFVLDWVAYWEDGGFRDEPLPHSSAKASYDAIRVYLWSGMLHSRSDGRKEALASASGMAGYLQTHETPPAEVLADGRVVDPNGGVGFSGALLPYLAALGRRRELETQRRRIQSQFDPSTGLYGDPPRYYDQNLILFGLGWSEGRFRFGPKGALHLEGGADT